MDNSRFGVKEVKSHEEVFDNRLKKLVRDFSSFTHFADILQRDTQRLMNETFMRAILSWKLELITQEPNAFRPWVTSVDGAEVLVNLCLVLCLAIFVDEHLQSNILMISGCSRVRFRSR